MDHTFLFTFYYGKNQLKKIILLYDTHFIAVELEMIKIRSSLKAHLVEKGELELSKIRFYFLNTLQEF